MSLIWKIFIKYYTQNPSYIKTRTGIMTWYILICKRKRIKPVNLEILEVEGSLKDVVEKIVEFSEEHYPPSMLSYFAIFTDRKKLFVTLLRHPHILDLFDRLTPWTEPEEIPEGNYTFIGWGDPSYIWLYYPREGVLRIGLKSYEVSSRGFPLKFWDSEYLYNKLSEVFTLEDFDRIYRGR